MKKLLFVAALMLFAGMSYGQIKVITNGDTGIGTTTPNEQLEVKGNIRLNNGGALTNVQVGVGRTSNGTAAFDFVSDASVYPTYGFRMTRFSAGKTAIRHRGTQSLSFWCEDDAPIIFKQAASAVMTIQTTGDVDIAGDANAMAFNVVSDKRLKKGIKDYAKGLDVILKLNPVSYQYTKEAGTITDKNFIGLLAQDLQEVAPELVSDYVIRVDGDDNEVGFKSSKTYLKIHDSQIKYLMINAMQEQQQMIDKKDAQINDLMDRVAKLEAGLSNISSQTINQSSIEINSSELKQNAPNPFHESTVINYTVSKKANSAILQVFDMNGQLLKSVPVAAGQGQLTINAKELAAGTYSYNLVVDGVILDSKKMVLTK